MSRDLKQLHEQLTNEIAQERQQQMAQSIADRRATAKKAESRANRHMKAMESAGLDVANLQALDRELAAEAETELMDVEARMDDHSQAVDRSDVTLDVGTSLIPDGAQLLTPSWSAVFSDLDAQDEKVEAAGVSAQTVLSGGGCKNYWNWAKGSGSGIAGSGVGKIQTWVEFGFWFKPPANRFYSIRPLFRFRGYVIVRADDAWYDSKYARVIGSAWTNVHQYNWKGWNHVDVYDVGDDNINVNTRKDIDRYTYNSYLLGGEDWAFIRCTIGLYAYARGGGSYAKNDFSTGNANFVCVPHVYVY